MDQKSGDGWFSGLIKIFVSHSSYFDAEFWSTWCEDCFKRWTKSSIIPTSKEESVWRNKKAQKQESFFRGRQIAYLICDYFRVTGIHDTVENHADLFTISLRNDDIQEFDSKWEGILLSMTKIPLADILEGLYKLKIREYDKLKTVLELYDSESHQKKLEPDNHRLKTLAKGSIEQEIRNKNFEIRNGNFEKNATVKNQGTKQRVRDNCSFRHDINKLDKVTSSNPSPNSFMQQDERKSSRTRSPRGRSPSGTMSRWPCKDYLGRTCSNSFCEKWHPPECLLYKTTSGCRFWERCSHAHRQVDEQPTRRSKTNNDKSAVAMLKKGDWQERELVTDECHDRPGKPGKRSVSSKRRSSDTRQLGCVFQEMTPPKSILQKSTDMPKTIQRVKFTKVIARHTKNSRPISFVRIHLPRWTSSAQLQRSKIWGSVSRKDRVAKARCPRSSVEAGHKCVKKQGAPKSNILLISGK